MKVAILGSGSRGNAIAVHADGETVLVDAGFGPRTILRRAREAGIPLTPLVGVAVTHEHGDHARGAISLARREQCPLLASPGTLRCLRPLDGVATIAMEQRRQYSAGGFHLEAARTEHDAREPVAIAVTGPAGIKVGVAYDLGRPTTSVRFLLKGCRILIIEANHDEVMLRTGPYPASVRRRIAGIGGHLSNRVAADLAAEVAGPELETVVLVHVSEQCNTKEKARTTVRAALRRRGFRGEVLVADQNVPLRPIVPSAAEQLVLTLQAEAHPPTR